SPSVSRQKKPRTPRGARGFLSANKDILLLQAARRAAARVGAATCHHAHDTCLAAVARPLIQDRGNVVARHYLKIREIFGEHLRGVEHLRIRGPAGGLAQLIYVESFQYHQAAGIEEVD